MCLVWYLNHRCSPAILLGSLQAASISAPEAIACYRGDTYQGLKVVNITPPP